MSESAAQGSLWARIRRIAPWFAAGRFAIVGAGLASMVAAATEPLVPALMQWLIDKGFASRTVALWWIPAALIGLFAIRGAAGFVAQYGLAWAAQRGVAQLREAMFNKLLDARAGLFGRESASALTNTLIYEVNIGAAFLVQPLLTLVKDSLTLLALLGYLLWLNWQLTLFVAVLFPAVALVSRTLSRRLHRLTLAGQKATDEAAYVVEENTLAWRIVRLHEGQAQQASRFTRASDALRRLTLKAIVAGATLTPLTQILAAIALSAVIVAALWQSGDGGATVGGFVAFITAMLMLVSPIKHLSEIVAPLTRGVAAIERAVALLNEHASESGGAHRAERARGDVTFEAVTMRYRDEQAAALDAIDLRIAAGEAVALVGPSGSGKSTLVNLLLRFIDPVAGRITLDGVALPDWNLIDLRRQFALVSQDVVLLNDSIAANVALGHEPDRARVERALADANLLDFVRTLPGGIDASVGHNGSELSGGQRQRLAIARAIYKNAPILILDEATSALDSESERLVQEALERLMRGRTSVVVAHRLSTIERADRIVVLEAGRIVEQGTHAELRARGGLYARLHALQFRTAA